MNAAPRPAPLTEKDLDALQAALERVPAPLDPLDVSALDGYLVGVLLQPRPVPFEAWWPGVCDVDGRALPPGFDARALQALVRRRHAELDDAIARRDWFDPWVFAGDDEHADEAADEHADEHAADAHAGAADAGFDDDEPPDAAAAREAVLPWVAGFAAAQDRFDALFALDNPALVEPLALVYLHFDAEDLEDADALLEVIETLEPPPDLAEAVQDLVRAVMLIADVSRPRRERPAPRRAPVNARPRPRGRAGPGPSRRSRSAPRAR